MTGETARGYKAARAYYAVMTGEAARAYKAGDGLATVM